MNNNDWLKNIKTGDKVIVSRGHWGKHYEIREVSHSTTNYVDVGRQRFRRKDGRAMHGGTWHRDYLLEPTPASLEEVAVEQAKREAHQKLSRHIEASKHRDYTLGQLNFLNAAFEKAEQI